MNTDARAQNNTAIQWPIGVGVIAFAVALVYQLVIISQPTEFLVREVFGRDDAFYYFKIARNMSSQGFASFDGIHASNGVQLLWNYFLVGLAYVVEDKEQFLRAALFLCLACNLVAGFFLRKAGQVMHSKALGDIALFLFAGLLIERWNTLQGMEYSLHLIIIFASAWCWWRVVMQTETVSLVAVTLLGSLLALNFWVRLDSVVFSLAAWVSAVWALARKPNEVGIQQGFFALSLVPALAAVGYVWASFSMAGTFLPISGSIKEFYADRFFEDVSASETHALQLRWWIKIQFLEVLALVPQSLFDVSTAQGYRPRFDMAVNAFAGVTILISAIAIAKIWSQRKSAPNSYRLTLVLNALFAVAAVHVAIIVLFIAEFSHVSRHYYGWLVFFWLFWGSLCLFTLLKSIPARAAKPVAYSGVAALSLAYLSIMPAVFSEPVPGATEFKTTRFALAPVLNDTLPQDAIVGAWNAGVLAYFLDRPVVNLDGLVNNHDFLVKLRKGVPLTKYASEIGITHLIDHDMRDLTMTATEARGDGHPFRNQIEWDQVTVVSKIDDIYVLEIIR